MADAARDGNRTPAILGVSSADGTTPVRIYVNPATGAMLTEGGGDEGGGDGALTLLATVTGIDATATTTTDLYTVPADKILIITKIVIRCTASDADGDGPFISFGGNDPTYNDFVADLEMTTLVSADTLFVHTGLNVLVTYATATVIKALVTTGSTNTAQTLAVDLFGYTLDA